MKKIETRLAAVLSVALLLPMAGQSIAASNPEQQADGSCVFFSKKAQTGALTGAGIGTAAALISGKHTSGWQKVGIAALGTAAGAVIGKILDNGDCEAAKTALQKMAESEEGEEIAWSNAESGNKGSMVATSAATTDASGKSCRNYKEKVTLKDGTQSEQNGIVCRDANGDYVPQHS